MVMKLADMNKHMAKRGGMMNPPAKMEGGKKNVRKQPKKSQ